MSTKVEIYRRNFNGKHVYRLDVDRASDAFFSDSLTLFIVNFTI